MKTTLYEWTPNRIWYANMPYKKYGLTHLQRMIIIRLVDDQLIIISPIELTTKLQLEIAKLGTIKAIVSPTPAFHEHLSDWWLAYSKAYFYATVSLVQKRTDLSFDYPLSNQSADLWQGQLLQTSIDNGSTPRRIIFCDPISGTLILPDSLFAVQSHLPLGQKLCTWAHGIRHELRYPYSERRKFKNKASLRASLQEIMTWPFDRILTSNGLIIKENGKEQFYQAFWWAFQ